MADLDTWSCLKVANLLSIIQASQLVFSLEIFSFMNWVLQSYLWLQFTQNRAAKIASPREKPECWETVTEICNRRVATDVLKSLNGLPAKQFA